MRKKKILISVLSVALVFAIIFGCCGIYLADYYKADSAAIAAFSQASGVVERELKGGSIAYGTGQETTAFIFYPGGKVEHSAYAPLMKMIAAKGVLCISVKMPFKLAVLDVNAADDIRERYPQVENWYIGGHSLGGSMAASHLGARTDKYKGLVLLGSYSTEDLSATSLDILSLYGSEDKVMNREKYEKYRPNLGKSLEEKIIEGGNHAYFGMYGRQEGDGEPTLSVGEQIAASAGYIYEFIKGGVSHAQDN